MTAPQTLTTVLPAYEVHNPDFSDMTLDAQIAAGVNDWAAEGTSGHLYFGRTRAQAEEIRAAYGAR